PWFEGGQMPLQRRLPKIGFNNPNKVVFQPVNLDDIARKGLTGKITPEALRAAGLIRSTKRPIKLLGRGEITEALQVQVHAASTSASDKIVKAGGTVEIIVEKPAE
ncbi:MAG TPA: 50S ribosomal protein L15, partial [Candidatus Latescibacteria bacterium]|nr:50S ribosomal protein L15 [Candidatus Latescibacterota bacterium]